MKDTIFKMCIIVIGIAFLIIYFFHSQNGRFHKIDDGVIDTQTGIIYYYQSSDKAFVSINYKTGKIKAYDPQVTNEQKYHEPKVPIAPAPAPDGSPAPESTGPAPEAN